MLRRQRESNAEATRRGYRYGQIGSASLVSLAHGTNDAQKTMGVSALALDADPDRRRRVDPAVGEVDSDDS
jgi:phosphate/sulfate permease